MIQVLIPKVLTSSTDIRHDSFIYQKDHMSTFGYLAYTLTLEEAARELHLLGDLDISSSGPLWCFEVKDVTGAGSETLAVITKTQGDGIYRLLATLVDEAEAEMLVDADGTPIRWNRETHKFER